MKMAITHAMLRSAFEQFVLNLRSQSVMTGEQWGEYVPLMHATFEDYCKREHAQLFATQKFVQLTSRTPFVGYPGDQTLRIELPPDVDVATLGASVTQVLDASRVMMLDYLEGRLRALERDEGTTFHRRQMEDLCARHGFKNPAALLKVTKSMSLSREGGAITLSPMRRVKADYFEGLGSDFDIAVPQASGPADVGQAVRATLDRCI